MARECIVEGFQPFADFSHTHTLPKHTRLHASATLLQTYTLTAPTHLITDSMSATFLATSAKPGFLGTQLAAAKRVAKPGKMAVVPMALLKTKVCVVDGESARVRVRWWRAMPRTPRYT